MREWLFSPGTIPHEQRIDGARPNGRWDSRNWLGHSEAQLRIQLIGAFVPMSFGTSMATPMAFHFSRTGLRLGKFSAKNRPMAGGEK